MGDKSSAPPGIDWEAYSSGALLATVAAIVAVLAGREVGVGPISQGPIGPAASEEAPEEEEGAQEAEPATASGGAGSTGYCWDYNLKDPNCGYRCRFCASACTRAPGRKLHPCYKCRHKK